MTKKFLATIAYSNSPEEFPMKVLVDSDEEALQAGLKKYLRVSLQEPLSQVLEESKGERGRDCKVTCLNENEERPVTSVVVWNETEDPRRSCKTHRSLEFAEGTSANFVRDERVWVKIEEWKPNPKKVESLEKLTHAELVEKILLSELR